MNRLLAGISALAASAALIAAAPLPALAADPAPVATACVDPAETIVEDAGYPQVVAVGVKKTQRMLLEVWTRAECAVTTASATVEAPRRTFRVPLTKVGTTIDGWDHWRSTLPIAPRSLRNSDAGVWPVTYDVCGVGADRFTVANKVLRASRLSFNAGPEPIENGRVTFAGKLERASWATFRYAGWRERTVPVTAFFEDHGTSKLVAAPRTRSDGTYRVSQRFPGYAEYHAEAGASSTTARARSRTDQVHPG